MYDGQQPQQFVEIIMSSIIERSNKLLHLIAVIHTALLEIVGITVPHTKKQQITDLHPFLPLPLKDRNPVESGRSSTTDRRSALNPDYSNKSTPQRSGHASGMHSAQQTSSAGTMILSFTPTHDALGQLGPAVEGVLLHFCEVTFDVVNKMVLYSHDLFSSMLWSGGVLSHPLLGLGQEEAEQEGEGEQAKKPSRVVSFNVPDSPEKVDSLAEVLKQEGGEIREKIGNLLSSISTRLTFI